MNKKTTLAASALAAIAMAAGCGHTAKTVSGDMGAKGECYGVNSCKGQGACGGPGHACASQNACKGQGWISLAKADCEGKGGKFKAH